MWVTDTNANQQVIPLRYLQPASNLLQTSFEPDSVMEFGLTEQ